MRAHRQQLRAIAAVAASGPHAESELIVHRLLLDAGITGWTANEPVRDGRGLIGNVDIAVRQKVRQKVRQHLAIEVDGHVPRTP